MRYKSTIVTFLLMLTFTSFVFFSCGEPGDNSQDISDLELPPSLNGQDKQSSVIINLSDAQVNQLKIMAQKVELEKFSYNLTIPGDTYPAPDNIFVISAPISGRVVKINYHEGEQVKKGVVLLEIESLEFADLVADFMQADSDEEYAIAQLDRIETLVERKISPYRAQEKAEAEVIRAGVRAKASYARLRAVGVTDDQINSWLAGEDREPRLKILAPISGTLTEHLIDVGQAVNSNDRLAKVVDLSKALVRGYASPDEGSIIQPGDPLKVTLRDYSNRIIASTVHTINPALDPINKSVTVNVLLNTVGGWPSPGQNVRLEIEVESPEPVIALPLNAIQYEMDQATIFVKKSDNEYEKRAVKVSELTADAAIVLKGLKAGEEVAITQVFSLKALGKYEEFAE